MMFDGKDTFKVPEEQMLFVAPQARQQLFINLIENYKIFCPDLNMIYAALNFNSALRIEYLVVFDVILNGKQLVLWDNPYVFTNRAIPAYRYAVNTNQHAAYFKECRKNFKQIEAERFTEFLGSDYCHGLTLDHDSERYWRNPDNAPDLMEGIADLGLLYTPKGFKNNKSVTQNLPSVMDLHRTVNEVGGRVPPPIDPLKG